MSECGFGEEFGKGECPGGGVVGVKAVDGMCDNRGIDADGCGDGGDAGGHVLQEFEATFVAVPFVVGIEGHDADVKEGDFFGFATGFPRSLFDFDVIEIDVVER